MVAPKRRPSAATRRHPAQPKRPATRPARSHLVALDASDGGRGALAAGRRLSVLAKRFLDTLELEGCELSLAIVGDERIRALKRSWFGIDEATDVLSFPAGDSPSPGRRILGDIVISLDMARRVAAEHGNTTERELALYLAHGLLHLLGSDHATPAQARAMIAEETRLLAGEGMLARHRRHRRRRASGS